MKGDWKSGPIGVAEGAIPPAAYVGQVAGVDASGLPLVRWRDVERPRPAVVVWMENAPEWRASIGSRVLLTFEGGDIERPIVLGLIDPPPASSDEMPETPRSMRFESTDELVLSCGKAKIALRSDGRIEIRGGYLISRSTGPNKIKGGTVHIN